MSGGLCPRWTFVQGDIVREADVWGANVLKPISLESGGCGVCVWLGGWTG